MESNSNTSQVEVPDINMRNTGFDVMCEFLNTSGIAAQSNILQVQFSY